MNSLELLGESQGIGKVMAYKKEHPVTETVAKLLFGPKKYDSIPKIEDIDSSHYQFVRQEDVMMHCKHAEGCDEHDIPELIKKSRETWCGKRVSYREVGRGQRCWEFFKSAKHPIVKARDNILVQYTVYLKDSRSDALIYLFCETCVLVDRSDDHTGLRCMVRMHETDFGHYGGFTEFVPEMFQGGNEDVSNFRRLVYEGEVRGDQTCRIPDNIVLKLGFLAPELKV